MFILNFGSLGYGDSETGWDEVRGFGQFLVPLKDLDHLRREYPRVNTEKKLLEMSTLFAKKFNSDVSDLTNLRFWVEFNFSAEDHEKSQREKHGKERRRRK